MRLPGSLLIPNPKKPTQKNSLYFRKWNFLVLVLKKIPHIFSKENLYYISENGTLQFSGQALKIKELHSRKIYYTSEMETLKKLIFSQKSQYLIFFLRIFLSEFFSSELFSSEFFHQNFLRQNHQKKFLPRQ